MQVTFSKLFPFEALDQSKPRLQRPEILLIVRDLTLQVLTCKPKCFLSMYFRSVTNLRSLELIHSLACAIQRYYCNVVGNWEHIVRILVAADHPSKLSISAIVALGSICTEEYRRNTQDRLFA